MQTHLLQRKIVAYILLFSCVNLFFGCQRFYRPVKLDTPSTHNKRSSLKRLADQNRYFILRKGKESYSLNDIAFDQAGMTLKCNVTDVSSDHTLYIKPQRKTRLSYSKSKHQDVVLQEVHLFVADDLVVDTSRRFVLGLSDIQKIEVIEFDKGRTTTSYVMGTLGIVLGAALVAVVIAAITYEEPEPVTTGSSCPYISAYDGEKYVLQGEVYGGAIFPQLQRDDYLPLEIALVNGTYKIKISNELQEIQHTDFADLLVVEHASDHKMMIDPDGKLYSISNPQTPVRAMLNELRDAKSSLLFKDSYSCLFNDPGSLNNLEELHLTFKNDLKSSKAKLVLNLKSSSWFDYLYGEFTSGFGSYYPTWVKKQRKEPSGNLEKWINEQNIPLAISVKTSQGWKVITQLKTIGPLLNREVVIPLDVLVNELAEVKLSCGYLFWELDYAAIDYSADEPFTISRLKPHEATNEQDANVLPVILHADKKYLNQPKTGDASILSYKSKEAQAGKIQTLFLHTRGYYEHVRNYKGTPKTAFLKSFKKPGAFPAFSKERFSQSWNTLVNAQSNLILSTGL